MTENQNAWFCLRSLPKQEHIAAAHLRQIERIEVFLPRIRFKRAQRKGIVWVTEALFPGYFFARFDWNSGLRKIQAARGVRGVVHFGDCRPVIEESVIRELRESIGGDEPRVIENEFCAGDAVKIASGALTGMKAVVSRMMPGKERVAILMEFLGRQTMIEVPTQSLLPETDTRKTFL